MPATATSVRASATGTAALDLVEDHVHRLAHRVELTARRRVAPDETLGEPDAAHLHRDRDRGSIAAEDELGGAAADVQHEERRGGVEASCGAEERELRPPSRRSRSRARSPRARGRARSNSAAFGRVPQGGRGGHPDPFGVQGACASRVPREHLDACARRRRARCRPVSSTPCPSRVITMSRASSSKPAFAVRLGHEQADRVRSLVDRGDAPGTLLVDAARRCRRPTRRPRRRHRPGGWRSARGGTSGPGRVPPTPPSASAPGAPRARSRAYSA